jgi:hypothetical protein
VPMPASAQPVSAPAPAAPPPPAAPPMAPPPVLPAVSPAVGAIAQLQAMGFADQTCQMRHAIRGHQRSSEVIRGGHGIRRRRGYQAGARGIEWRCRTGARVAR